MLESEWSFLFHPEASAWTFPYWPKTDFLFFILEFDNKSKKTGRRYKKKCNLSGCWFVLYFYRIFSCFPNCEDKRRAIQELYWFMWKEHYKTQLICKVASCLSDVSVSVFACAEHGPKCTNYYSSIIIQDKVSWGHWDLGALLCWCPWTFWAQF